MDELYRILLSLNRISVCKSNGISYTIRTTAHYSLDDDGVIINYKLNTHQRFPKKDLEAIQFDNVELLKRYLVKQKEYWMKR